jgi:AcrR family transcriptional regulator
MGHKHTKDEILAAALQTALAEGLSRLTYGRVARRAGTSDRIVAYYFPTTADLAREVLSAVGIRLQETLAHCLTDGVLDHVEMLRIVWPALAEPAADPIFALYFEAAGLAAARREPFATHVPHLVEAWIGWAAQFLQCAPGQRRGEAEAAIAVIDGLMLLRQLAGPDAADRAAGRLGAEHLPDEVGR